MATPDSLSLFRAHALGNDYLVVDAEDLPFPLAPTAVRLLCDRHRGVGADGILVRVPSAVAEVGLRIFNPDGSEAEKSGNGLRIFGTWLVAERGQELQRSITVETAGGTVALEVLSASADGVFDVKVQMGRASFRSRDVGLVGPDREMDVEMLELPAGDRVTANPVSLGNPHCVIFEDVLDSEELRRRAPQIATHPWFAKGVNVQFARATGPAVLELWVWERGAGETLASGSSACAAAAVAVRRGLVSERQVTVRMPGGTLQVEVGTDFSLELRGPVETVCRAELTDGFVRRLGAGLPEGR